VSQIVVAESYLNPQHCGEIVSQILKKVLDCVSFHCSTACLVGITGVLAPLLEETVFRGFFMTSLTKWYWLPSYLFLSI